MSEAKLFAVIFPHQKEQVGAWCWGEGCGKGHVGAMDLGVSMAVACSEAACPFEEKVSENPFGDSDSRLVYVRKLRELGDGE